MRKIWIDTDAGTDDAVALMIAMSSTDTDIMGISTVGGNVALECVVQNVLFLIELYRQNIPVHVGASQPLKRRLGKADFIHGKDGLGDIGLKLKGRQPSDILAIDGLISAIKKSDGQLELLMLGPLTNLAKAIQKDPSILTGIKHCYIMGGLISGPGNVTAKAEYNFWADPEAADFVLHQNMPITTIGWDTTVSSGYFTVEEIEELKREKTKAAKIAANIQFVRIKWQKSQGLSPTVTWADPTATMAMLYPESILSEEKGGMTIDLDEGENRGVVRFAKHPKGPITHITVIDRLVFKKVIHEAVSTGFASSV